MPGGSSPLPGTGTPGRGLIAQAAQEKQRILITDAPPDYITIISGPGSARPAGVVILPILFEDQVLGVIELASLSRFSDVHLAFIDQFANTIGVSINTIIANSRTESLLAQSQRLSELRERSEELQRSKAALEEKAALLATASQYKSDFLANMSHELRTPLNSLLILAQLLADNPDAHLSEQEVQFASTIHRAGSDLLQLISDILDLSKIEAGRMDVHPKTLPLNKLLDYVHATFRPLTIDRGLRFEIAVGGDVPRELYSDEQRLQQVLRNLLSNAVKFTHSGSVELRVDRVPREQFEEETLKNAEAVIAFAVKDTGTGIAPEKLPVIFEAFQQSEGMTNRKYGGTGLGLSISREIAGMLGGRTAAESEPGVGSRFTLYVPSHHPGVPAPHTPAELRASSPSGATAPTSPPTQTDAAGAAVDDAPVMPGDVLDNAGSPSPERLVAETLSPDTLSPDTLSPDTLSPDTLSAEFLSREDLLGRGATRASGSREDTWPETTRLKERLSGRPGRVLAGRPHPHRRRRHPQRLRAHSCTGPRRHDGEVRGERPRRPRSTAAVPRCVPGPDGHHDAGDGRIRDYSGHSTCPRLAHLPIIALTAKAMPGDRRKAIDSGASDYIPKRVNVDRLLSLVCDLLDPHDSRAEVPDSAVPQKGGGSEGHDPEGRDHEPPGREP